MRSEPDLVGRGTASERGEHTRVGRRGRLLAAWLSGALAAGATGLAFTPAAHAQDKPAAEPAVEGPPISDIDRARALAKQANKALQKAQSYAEALDYATRAEALYHAPIHLAIIGEALIGMGRGAEAMATLERLVSEPLPANAPEAFRTAQEDGQRRLKELSARVPSLLLVVKGAPPGAVTVTVDDKPFALKGGTATRLDAGVHKIHATAPGFPPFNQPVTLPARGGVVILDVTFDVAGAPATEGDTRGASGIAGDTHSVPPRPPSRVPWIAAFGVGAAGLVVGGVTGGIFVSQVEALKAGCPANRCPATEQARAQSIGTLGNASTVGLIVGGVGVVTGGVVLLTQRLGGSSPRKTEGSSSQQGFALGLTPGGVSARGWF
jgi:hypothetical protein